MPERNLPCSATLQLLPGGEMPPAAHAPPGMIKPSVRPPRHGAEGMTDPALHVLVPLPSHGPKLCVCHRFRAAAAAGCGKRYARGPMGQDGGEGGHGRQPAERQLHDPGLHARLPGQVGGGAALGGLPGRKRPTEDKRSHLYQPARLQRCLPHLGNLGRFSTSKCLGQLIQALGASGRLKSRARGVTRHSPTNESVVMRPSGWASERLSPHSSGLFRSICSGARVVFLMRMSGVPLMRVFIKAATVRPLHASRQHR